MKFFKPGMQARQSGVYEALHGGSHRLQHEVIIAAHTIFPSCRRCGVDVRFRLLQPMKKAEQGWVGFGILFEPYRSEGRVAGEPEAA